MPDPDQMEEALHRIVRWSQAYPLAVFPEPDPKEWGKAREAMHTCGLSLDKFSASNMRHVIQSVGKIARDGLGQETEMPDRYSAEAEQARLDSSMKRAVQTLEQVFPHCSIVLLVTPFGSKPGRRVNYIGNSHRDEMITLMKELLARWEQPEGTVA